MLFLVCFYESVEKSHLHPLLHNYHHSSVVFRFAWRKRVLIEFYSFGWKTVHLFIALNYGRPCSFSFFFSREDWSIREWSHSKWEGITFPVISRILFSVTCVGLKTNYEKVPEALKPDDLNRNAIHFYSGGKIEILKFPQRMEKWFSFLLKINLFLNAPLAEWEKNDRKLLFFIHSATLIRSKAGANASKNVEKVDSVETETKSALPWPQFLSVDIWIRY